MSESSTGTPELFYHLAGEDNAAARRLLVELDLVERVRMRNMHYPEVEADFVARGGTTLPALWDGATLVQGIAAVRPALEALARK